MTQDLIQEIVLRGLANLPNEACGVAIEFPSDYLVFELENESLEPENSTVLATTQIIATVPDDILTSISPEQMIIWHTHPSGGVGPSKLDMLNRAKDGVGAKVRYLTVALPHGEASYY